MNYKKIPLEKNDQKKRFEMHINGHKAFINFKELKDHIALIHTEVDPELSGKGAASALVEKTLKFIEESNRLVLPFCPFVLSYVKNNPEWKRLVSKRFHGYHTL